MNGKVVRAESAWLCRCATEGFVDPPDRLAVVQKHIDEATRMLDALRARIPRVN